MDDDRVWAFEESLWTADAEHYRASIDAQCLMVLPNPPFVLSGDEAVAAVSATPRWSSVELTERRVARPEEGLIVVAYHVKAARDDEAYEAHCTSTYRRRGHEDWQVVQHQQTPPLGLSSAGD
ncbi:nuclear transport factor 2 family protein [Sphingomonas endolithica]|uniref:nuclear transport factor 2 family protein n=1 Tax=Sphingomonas endolithica TaxID=2972485 RepID=UPI0021AEE889|nr:nuclear transport factor 2 family protein [Sphingomonas sp. ZFBP2030]